MAANTQDIEPISDAMDYAQHNGTWQAFTKMVKWSIVVLAFLVVGLYCIIFGGQPLLGGLLIVLGIVVSIFGAARRTR